MVHVAPCPGSPTSSDALAVAATGWTGIVENLNTKRQAAPVPVSLGTMAAIAEAAPARTTVGSATTGKDMKMHHELKILIPYFEAGKEGSKNFEIRRNNDRGFQKGDTVEFREINSLGTYTWSTFRAEITYVTNFNQKEDYVVFGYKIIE